MQVFFIEHQDGNNALVIAGSYQGVDLYKENHENPENKIISVFEMDVVPTDTLLENKTRGDYYYVNTTIFNEETSDDTQEMLFLTQGESFNDIVNNIKNETGDFLKDINNIQRVGVDVFMED